MSRFTADEYWDKVQAGIIGTPNLIDELVDQEDKNEILKAALDAAKAELVSLDSWRFVMDSWSRIAFEAVASGDDSFDQEWSIMIDQLARAVALIKWLALPWADNEPLWPTHDSWTGRALEANAMLLRSWREFVRDEIEGSTGNPVEQETPAKSAGATKER